MDGVIIGLGSVDANPKTFEKPPLVNVDMIRELEK